MCIDAGGERALLGVGRGRRFSTFYGTLYAADVALAGNCKGAVEMLDPLRIEGYAGCRCHTTFGISIWGLPDAGRIDETGPHGKERYSLEIIGRIAIKGFPLRLLLPWMGFRFIVVKQYVLGVQMVEPGYIYGSSIIPHLGKSQMMGGGYVSLTRLIHGVIERSRHEKVRTVGDKPYQHS